MIGTENIPFIPQREIKPRKKGVSMVMDKGLSVREAEDLCSSSSHLIDYVKLGFGTSLFTNKLKEKVEVYQKNDIDVYLGGTLFEAYFVRGLLDDYLRLLDSLKITTVEISDGSVELKHDLKCELIAKTSKNYRVLSEVGYKDTDRVLRTHEWAKMLSMELQAGSTNVIAEARESGSVGIFDSKGGANIELIDYISKRISMTRLIWEAPLKSQQAWFINHFGHDVNLGNIAPNEVIALETLRSGLRGDTFANYLPKGTKYLI